MKNSSVSTVEQNTVIYLGVIACVLQSNLLAGWLFSQDPSCCYIEGFVAPLSWVTLTAPRGNYFDSSDYKTLLWAAKPVLQNIPSARMMLPARVDTNHMIAMSV